MTFVPPTEAGTWFVYQCHNTSEGPGRLVFVPGGSSPALVVSPRQLSVQAENQLTVPVPSIQLSPAATPTQWQYLHVPTWAWIPAAAWVALHATASVPGVVVTATATPVRIDISYTDGTRSYNVVCDGPGTPYSDALAVQIDPAVPLQAASPDCGWTYQDSSARYPNEEVPVNVGVVYNASWTVTGAAGGGSLGTVTSPAENFSVKVGEVEALNVAPPGN